MPPSNILHAKTDPTMLARLKEMLGSSARADIAVGYFFVSGFVEVADEISRLSKTRILVGRPDRPTLEVVAAGLHQARPLHAQLESDQTVRRSQRDVLAGNAVADVSRDIGALPQTAESQAAVTRLRQLVSSGFLEMRTYPREFLHAKAYLCWYEGHAEPGAAIVGSSNFTLAGFQGNTELNVRVTGDQEMGALKDWFDTLWEDSVDITDQVALALDECWAVKQYPPYLVYLKALYELFGRQLDAPQELPLEPFRQEDLANFQIDAVRRGLDMIRTYGGCYIADVVGLGKSYIGAELLRQLRQSYPLDGPPLVICPAGLVGMWEHFNERFGLGAAVVSQSRIAPPSQLVFNVETEEYDEADPGQGINLTETYRNRGPVLVDEAHNFRNVNGRSRGLKDYLEQGDHKVILLSATPQNLGTRDIYRQISLFLDETDHGLPIEPLALEDYFNSAQRWREYRKAVELYAAELQAYLSSGDQGPRPGEPTRPGTPPADISEALSPIFVRRRRKDIHEIYGDTATINGKPIRFPEPKLSNLNYRLDQVYRKAGDFNDLLATMGRHKGHRYNPTRYLKPEHAGDVQYEGLFRARGRIAAMIQALLFKRLESSIAAFRSTLTALITSNRNFKAALESGYVPVGRIASDLLAGQDFNPEEALNILEREAQNRSGRHVFRAEDFKVLDWMNDLDADYAVLSEMKNRVKDISPEDDDKLKALKKFLQEPDVKRGKVLIFSEAETTVKYLYEELNPGGKNATMEYLSGERRDARDGIIRRFAPRANLDNPESLRSQEIRVLLATDVVSEGQNLQDCARVLNYDLHWNPVRLIQRFGRVDRIGSEYEEIYLHNMLPDTELDETLDLTPRLSDRIQAMHDIIGLDNYILSDSEKMNPQTMGAIYDELKLPETDDEFEELSINQRAMALLQHIRNNDEDLWRRVAELPDGIRSALVVSGGLTLGSDQPREGETIVMMASNDALRCYAVDDGLNPRQITPAQFISAAECLPGTGPAALPENTNDRVNAVEKVFLTDLTRILGDGRRRVSGNLRNRQFIQRQLNGVGDDVASPQRVNILRQVFTDALPTIVENEISELRRLNLAGRELVLRLELLQERYRLNPTERSVASNRAQQVTRVVCSDGLQARTSEYCESPI